MSRSPSESHQKPDSFGSATSTRNDLASGEAAAFELDARTSNGALELGIPGIAARSCDLILGSMYALKASTASARYPLFASLLLNAMRIGRKCFLITESKPEEFLARLDSHWGIKASDMIADGQLLVFSTQPEVTKKIFRYGADRFVQELSSFGLNTGDLLLYDQADDVISLHDPFLARQQVEVMGKWFQSNKITALLSFSRPSDRQADTFNTLMDYFTGIARLGGDKEGLELTFMYWKGSAGATVARNYRLLPDENGLYEAFEAEKRSGPKSGNGTYVTQAPPLIVDDRRVSERAPHDYDTQFANFCYFYNDAALDSLLINLPGIPLRVSGVKEFVENASQHEKAMIIINTAGITPLKKMAQVVHHLRCNLSKTIQIVVYAKSGGASEIRDFSPQESQLLLRCGANAVLPAEQLISNLVTNISNLRRQIFIRPIEDDFEELWQMYEQEMQESVADLDEASDIPDSLPALEPTQIETAVAVQPSAAYAYRNPNALTPDSSRIQPKAKTLMKARRSTFAS